MRIHTSILSLVLLITSGVGFAQEPPPASVATQPRPIPAMSPEESVPAPGPAPLPAAPSAALPERPAAPHRFWDRTNAGLFAGVVAMRGLDYASTRNMLARGREEELIPDDIVNNTAGFIALEAAGAATSIGISYIFHRTGHHKLERWLSIGHIGVAGFGAARNYLLETRHPAPMLP